MRLLAVALLLFTTAVLAADYRPTVQGPAGAALRYEIRTVKEGAGGKSSSSQSGSVKLGQSGTAGLATTNISVTPQDRYRIAVKLLEGSRVVAEETVNYPR